jgi:dCTP deaminase
MIDRSENRPELSDIRPSVEDMYGTLPDWAIRQFIERGDIQIDPLQADWRDHIDPVSIDFHLGKEIKIPRIDNLEVIDVKEGVRAEEYETVILQPDDPFVLQPKTFVLVPTLERLVLPNNVMGLLHGKSSLARFGIVVHLTAGRFDPGWNNNPVLELHNSGERPVRLYAGWPICAFTFDRLMAPVENPYTTKGRYQGKEIHSQVQIDGSNHLPYF